MDGVFSCEENGGILRLVRRTHHRQAQHKQAPPYFLQGLNGPAKLIADNSDFVFAKIIVER